MKTGSRTTPLAIMTALVILSASSATNPARAVTVFHSIPSESALESFALNGVAPAAGGLAYGAYPPYPGLPGDFGTMPGAHVSFYAPLPVPAPVTDGSSSRDTEASGFAARSGPEMFTWTMMLFGFAAIGFTAWHRSKRPFPLAA